MYNKRVKALWLKALFLQPLGEFDGLLQYITNEIRLEGSVYKISTLTLTFSVAVATTVAVVTTVADVVVDVSGTDSATHLISVRTLDLEVLFVFSGGQTVPSSTKPRLSPSSASFSRDICCRSHNRI
jgi:hypothetical protein